jgi:hypothetical protein
MDEPREDTRPEDEQEVEGHGGLAGGALSGDKTQVDESDEDVEAHSPPLAGKPPLSG